MADRLTEILHERHDTGAYADALLVMSKPTLAAFVAALPVDAPLPSAPWNGVLWGIPLMLDAELPLGAWRLLERSTGDEIESGSDASKEGRSVSPNRSNADLIGPVIADINTALCLPRPPRTWELPPEPGPEVTRLRMVDADGPLDDVFVRDDDGWWLDEGGRGFRWRDVLGMASMAGGGWLVDATEETTP
jgi:hypothetical protein